MKNDYSKKFSKLSSFMESFPHFICPQCKIGHIHRPEEILKIETGASKDAYGHDAWDPSWIQEIWAGIGICSNKECKQPYSFSGDVETLYDDPDTFIKRFIIKNVYPEILLFNIPELYPEDAALELAQSFSLVFSNPPASANALRISIELFLTHLKIKKFKIVKGKKHRLTLHERIQSYLSTGKYSSLSKYVEAIKWIGNAGSHNPDLTVENVLQAYEFVEIIFTDLTLKEKTLKAKSSISRIIKNKRPLY